MKKIISVLLVIVFCFSFASCKKKTEVSRKAIDKRFTPAHTETSTSIDIALYLLLDVPIIETETRNIPDKYEILYLITYDDGTETQKWEIVTEAEYNEGEAK